MKTKIFLFSVLALLFAACNNNEPENNVKTYSQGDLTFSYYLSDIKKNIRNSYATNEWLVIHLDIQNDGQDTIMVNADNLGLCYDCKNQLVESMSAYIKNDTLPVFKPLLQGSNVRFTYTYLVDVPANTYHYQNPHIFFYTKGNEIDMKDIIIPLTINFNVQ